MNNSHIFWGKVNWYYHLGKLFDRMYNIADPVIQFIGKYSRKVTTQGYQKTVQECSKKTLSHNIPKLETSHIPKIE